MRCTRHYSKNLNGNSYQNGKQKDLLKKITFTAKLMFNPSNQEKYLLVAGGVDESNEPLDSVELLKIGSNSWQTGK